jgi:hypothetical protein
VLMGKDRRSFRILQPNRSVVVGTVRGSAYLAKSFTQDKCKEQS